MVTMEVLSSLSKLFNWFANFCKLQNVDMQTSKSLKSELVQWLVREGYAASLVVEGNEQIMLQLRSGEDW